MSPTFTQLSPKPRSYLHFRAFSHTSHLIHHQAALASLTSFLPPPPLSMLRAPRMASSPSSFRSRLRRLAMVTSLLTPSLSTLLPYFKGLFSISPHWNVISMRQACVRCSISGIWHQEVGKCLNRHAILSSLAGNVGSKIRSLRCKWFLFFKKPSYLQKL